MLKNNAGISFPLWVKEDSNCKHTILINKCIVRSSGIIDSNYLNCLYCNLSGYYLTDIKRNIKFLLLNEDFKLIYRTKINNVGVSFLCCM